MAPLAAADYLAERTQVDGFEAVRLVDRRNDVEVYVLTGVGNNAYRMSVRGTNILWSPFKTLYEWKEKPAYFGNPLLSPWANRIDGDAYFANGKRYVLNPHLGNFRRDRHEKPLHGVLAYAPWELKSVAADSSGAVLVSRLEFWRQPDWMAQFPFAHALEVTHRLRDGALEIETVVENLSSEPMPVSLGYHPYFQVSDAPRDEWAIHLPARKHVRTTEELIPTGEIEPNTLADPLPLAGVQLDDGFVDLERGPDGRAVFWLQGRKQRVLVEFGPEYPVAVVFAPPGRGFVCFEPMTAVTNAFNLAHAGRLPIPSIPPGQRFRASFRIRTEGF
jgi:aldose 1-epimerase